MDNNIKTFLELVSAGLWEKKTRLSQFGKVDYEEVMRLAEEQSVVGLVTSGLEHVDDVKVPQDVLLQFIGSALQIEQQNTTMNEFIGRLVEKMREAGVESVLIKGQGVAQCYERPLWRTSGDVDLLLNEDNYEKGKTFLAELIDAEPEEYNYNKEYITSVHGWCLELHGSLRCGLSAALNRCLDDVQSEICDNHHVRYWEIDDKKISLPEENMDVLVIFTHYIKHFYKGGLGIRQICDWCRLLWKYRESIDIGLIENRLRSMGLIPEWKAFAAFAVEYLGMPTEAIPLYSNKTCWKRKAGKLLSFIIKVGNFGHNMDRSYYSKYPFLIRKTISMWRRMSALFKHSTIFPLQTLRYFPHVIYAGLWSAVRGE